MDNITVKYEKIKKMIEVLDKVNTDNNADIRFEFVVGSLFPKVLDNIKEEMRRQHALGYIEGSQVSRPADAREETSTLTDVS